MTSLVPKGTAAPYPPDLYRFDTVAEYVDSAELVGPEEAACFARNGYLAVRSVLNAAEVDEVLAGLAAVLESPGSAQVEYEQWGEERLAAEPDLSGERRMDLIRKLMRFVPEDDRLQRAAGHPAIAATVQRLAAAVEGRSGARTGATMTPMELYQDMALLKPPAGGREKPWHQDNAYFHLEPGTPIIGVWIALDAATPENGCMHVKPGSHEHPVLHFQRRDLQICDTEVDRDNDVVVPLRPGDALFFHGLLVHGTPANRTTTRRRAVQFHYIPAATAATSDEQHLAIFGGDALGASC